MARTRGFVALAFDGVVLVTHCVSVWILWPACDGLGLVSVWILWPSYDSLDQINDANETPIHIDGINYATAFCIACVQTALAYASPATNVAFLHRSDHTRGPYQCSASGQVSLHRKARSIEPPSAKGRKTRESSSNDSMSSRTLHVLIAAF